MTKKEFIATVADYIEEDAKIVSKVFDGMVFIIKEQLISEEPVRLSKLGIFQTQMKKARTITNKFTKQVMEVPQKRVIKYKPSKYMREQVDMKA
ncbi:HU family DNA-binding protein [Mycoplasma corogypsi]|uniref:HU family DNA-binding protein n=1 Tax=Mycoplasma corogypsi TaxID=2106 RepID=UPI00387323E8